MNEYNEFIGSLDGGDILDGVSDMFDISGDFDLAEYELTD